MDCFIATFVNAGYLATCAVIFSGNKSAVCIGRPNKSVQGVVLEDGRSTTTIRQGDKIAFVVVGSFLRRTIGVLRANQVSARIVLVYGTLSKFVNRCRLFS